MFKLKEKEKLSTTLKGWLQSPIQYEDRLGKDKWQNHFGHYQNQRWGYWDSNSCWFLGGVINPMETQLEMLDFRGMFSKEAKDFFISKRIKDEDNDFSLSERCGEILGKNYDTGGTAEEGMQLVQKYGCIAREILGYTEARANSFSTREAFVADYFNPKAVTPEMLALGQEFLKYVNISYQFIGKAWTTPDLQILRAALKQAPLSIGVPVPNQTAYWNAEVVQWDGTRRADHCVELYDIDDQGNYKIYDQYEPHLKTLAKGYFIPLVRQIIVTATPQMVTNPVPQNVINNSVWQAVIFWFQQFWGNRVVA
jgi:hypothetical protein